MRRKSSLRISAIDSRAARGDRSQLGCFVAAAIVCSWLLGPLARGAEGPQTHDAALERAKEAALAARGGLQSGIASGTFNVVGGQANTGARGRFRAAFEGDRQYLRIEFLPGPDGEATEDSRRIIVNDGFDTFLGRFSPLLTGTGAEGTIYPGVATSAATGAFAQTIRQVVQGGFPPSGIGDHDVKVDELENGHYRCAYLAIPDKDYWRTYEIAPEKGWNCVSFTALGGSSGEETGQKYTAGWTEQGGRWYSDFLAEEMYREGTLQYRTEIAIEQFQPNVPVPANLFTLEALELPEGSRILDQRSAGPINVYRMTEDDSQKAATRLADRVEAMPEMYKTGPIAGHWTWGRLAGIAIGVFGLVGIAVIWLVRRKVASSRRDEARSSTDAGP